MPQRWQFIPQAFTTFFNYNWVHSELFFQRHWLLLVAFKFNIVLYSVMSKTITHLKRSVPKPLTFIG